MAQKNIKSCKDCMYVNDVIIIGDYIPDVLILKEQLEKTARAEDFSFRFHLFRIPPDDLASIDSLNERTYLVLQGAYAERQKMQVYVKRLKWLFNPVKIIACTDKQKQVQAESNPAIVYKSSTEIVDMLIAANREDQYNFANQSRK